MKTITLMSVTLIETRDARVERVQRDASLVMREASRRARGKFFIGVGADSQLLPHLGTRLAWIV